MAAATAAAKINILVGKFTLYSNFPTRRSRCKGKFMLAGNRPSMITWKWAATVQHDTAGLGEDCLYEPTIGMALVGETRDGWENPVSLELAGPGGAVDVGSNKVNPTKIGMNSFTDFSFPAFVATGSGTITLTAATEQQLNLSSALVVADRAWITEGKYTAQMRVEWRLEFITEFDSQDLERGSVYEFSIPLTLEGEFRRGWEDPVILRLQMPDGKELSKRVSPREIPLNKHRDFTSRMFEAPSQPGKITLTVCTTQTRNLRSMLRIGDPQLRI